jgi:hypothetical protein
MLCKNHLLGGHVENKNVRTIQAISKAITASMSSFQTELNSIENLQN